MDYLHFQDDNDEDEDDKQSVSSEDSLERRNEIEARLYSIIHHNDLSHSLPPDLSECFAVDYSENGEIIVSLNEDLDETKKINIFNKINLIKNCDQSVDSDSDREEEEDQVAGGEKLEKVEFKENVENISNTVNEYSNSSDKNKTRNSNVLQDCGISNSVKNKITNSGVLHGYENRIESSCMLRHSDWKVNSKMEYISFKEYAKNKISKVLCDKSVNKTITDAPNSGLTTGVPKSGLTTVAPKRGMVTDTLKRGKATDTPNRGMTTDTPTMGMTTDTPNRGLTTDTPNRGMTTDTPNRGLTSDTPKRGMTTDTPNRGMITDTPKRGMTTDTQKREMTTDTQKKEMMGSQSDKQKFPDDNIDYSIHNIEIRLRRLQKLYDKLVNNPYVPIRKRIASGVRLERVNKLWMKLKEKKMRMNNSSTAAGVDNEPSDFTVKCSDGNSICDSELICTSLPSISVSNECIALDSDNEVEVIELESDLSVAKQNADVSNMLNSVSCDNGDDIICNFVNTPDKPCNEPDIINLESSEDERRQLNSANNKTHSKHKKLLLPDTPKKWTKNMIKFYCKTSKERRRFDCLNLIKDMRKTSSWSDWVISKADLSGIKKNTPRCRRCHEFGHVARRCKTPINPVCYMCGEPCHKAGRCPQAMCLFCGRKMPYYTEKCTNCSLRLLSGEKCEICKGDHWIEICPDLWRCYHLTTKEGPIVIPSEQKVNPRRYCWVCGGKGHFAHECNNPQYGSKEDQTTPFVTNYSAVSTQEEREIVLSVNAQTKLNSSDGEKFLQELCNRIKVRFDYVIGNGLPVIKVFGNVKEWKIIRHEISKFVGESFRDQHMTVNQDNNYDMHTTNNKEKNVVHNNIGQKQRNTPKRSSFYNDIVRIMSYKNTITERKNKITKRKNKISDGKNKITNGKNKITNGKNKITGCKNKTKKKRKNRKKVKQIL